MPAFSGNVTIVMDASKGGFNAVDRWRNDISGAGKLVKQGTGTLKLAGASSWTGGTELSCRHAARRLGRRLRCG